MGASAAALWINSFFASFDEGLTLFIHNLLYPMHSFFTPFFTFVSLLGKGGIFLIILSLAMIFFKRTRRMGTAMLIAVTVGAIFTNCCLKILIARPRPYADESSIYYRLWLLVGQHTESDKSFPSGHTTAAFATMTALFLTGDKRYSWTAFIFAFLMAVARIYLVVHYPSDVLAGILVGAAAGLIGVLITVKIPHRWFELEFTRSGRKGGGGKHEKRDAA